MTRFVASVFFWLWFFPFLIVLNAVNIALNFVAFIFLAPTHAWKVATEATSEM